MQRGGGGLKLFRLYARKSFRCLCKPARRKGATATAEQERRLQQQLHLRLQLLPAPCSLLPLLSAVVVIVVDKKNPNQEAYMLRSKLGKSSS